MNQLRKWMMLVEDFNPENFLKRVQAAYILSVRGASVGEREGGKFAMQRLLAQGELQASRMDHNQGKQFLKRLHSVMKGEEVTPIISRHEHSMTDDLPNLDITLEPTTYYQFDIVTDSDDMREKVMVYVGMSQKRDKITVEQHPDYIHLVGVGKALQPLLKVAHALKAHISGLVPALSSG